MKKSLIVIMFLLCACKPPEIMTRGYEREVLFKSKFRVGDCITPDRSEYNIHDDMYEIKIIDIGLKNFLGCYPYLDNCRSNNEFVMATYGEYHKIECENKK